MAVAAVVVAAAAVPVVAAALAAPGTNFLIRAFLYLSDDLTHYDTRIAPHLTGVEQHPDEELDYYESLFMLTPTEREQFEKRELSFEKREKEKQKEKRKKKKKKKKTKKKKKKKHKKK